MNLVDFNSVKLTLPYTTNTYAGDRNEYNFRNGDGVEYWKKPRRQYYAGQFFQDCLHNIGSYDWYIKNEKYTYEGKFYANKLEGYGKLTYPDGSIYEGLFLLNKRYGPGVLTYADGKQDIGIWTGKSLVRLNQTLLINKVPTLAKTVEGKAYLLKYKHLVPITKQMPTETQKLISEIAGDKIIQECRLFSMFVRNPSSLFFNTNQFNDSYYTDPAEYTIDIIDSIDGNITTTIIVTDLLTWNNEPLAISIMKHSFKHRNYENCLSYQVSDVLTGHRDIFNEPGPQEIACMDFLSECCYDRVTQIKKLICTNDLYLDLTDSLGNTGLTYAAAFDQHYVIKLLVNFGANVDHVNDECLTPILLCLLRYICCKFEITDWENAFIPQVQIKEPKLEIQEWRNIPFVPQEPNEIDLMNKKKEIDAKNEKNNKKGKNDHKEDNAMEDQKYMFDLKCVHRQKSKKRKKPKKEQKPKKEKKKDKNKTADALIEEPVVLPPQCLETICDTVLILLQSGADVNFGEVPFPPLILSIFTKSDQIVSSLIHFGANCNIRTAAVDGYLTPLHIIASLPISTDNVLIARMLLEHGANPNLRTNDLHWVEEKTMLLAGTNVPDFGKTPLQLLCIRYDFKDDPADQFGDICSLFINYGTDLTCTYLDHTYLTLAIVRGNISVMRRILDSKIVNPNQELDNDMGVPLSVLILKRYKNILQLDVCESVFNTLLEYLANPFVNVPKFKGNVIEFCGYENGLSAKIVGKNKKKRKSKKKSGHDQVIQLLHDCAERTLVKHIQGFVVKALYQYKIECGINDPIFENIVKFVTVPEAMNVLQILLENKKVIPNKMFSYELVQYVMDRMNTSKKEKKKKHMKGKTDRKQSSTPLSLVEELDFLRRPSRKQLFGLVLPEIDPKALKYKVCFECFQKVNKVLVLCPKCELVYFCSKECNLRSNKRNTRHKCKINFYDSELKKQQQRIARGEDIYYVGKFGCFNTYRKDIIKNTPDYFNKMTYTGGADPDNPFGKMFNTLKRAADEKERAADGHKSRIDTYVKEGKGKSKSRVGKRSKSKASKKDRSESRGKGNRKKSKADKVGKRKSGKAKASEKDRSKSKGEGDRGAKSKIGQSDASPDRGGDDKLRGLASGAGGDAIDGFRESEDDRESRLKDGVISDAYRNAISETCSEFDFNMNFLNMFMPYCVFTDGQLYYKFKRTHAFYKLTYSNV